MTKNQLDMLKAQLPISLEITMSMDYPNGITAQNQQFTRPDNSIGIMQVEPEPSAFARITGTISQYGVIITWKYQNTPDKIQINYIGPSDGEDIEIPFDQLKSFLLKLKS